MKRIITGIFLLLLSFNLFAGSNAGGEIKHEPEAIVTFAKDVEKYAASKGARAFIIARVGRPQKDLPKGIEFTHTAIAIYSDITLDSGEVVQGYAIHNLYQRNEKPDRSFLMTDYPVDFFWSSHDLKAGILIPTEDMQLRLIEMITSGKNKELHNDRYSVLANPMNSKYQNCTEHTLDIINAAIYQTTDIERLKANTKAHFEPQRVRTGGFKLLLGELFRSDITTNDHKGKVYTTTFMSIARYLEKYDLLAHGAVFKGPEQVTAI